MIAALDVKPTDTVCEIGTGTGYCTALLAQFAKEIVSVERYQTLAVEAAARIRAFGLAHVEILWADGFELHVQGRTFDKVITHGIVAAPARAFVDLVAPDGAMIAAFAGPGRAEQRIVRLTFGADGPVHMADFGRARGLRPLERGLSHAL
jgi:protein-L-isoaspartate(D-aspartate) O-methyltransferase